jgi:hypothetical protein
MTLRRETMMSLMSQRFILICTGVKHWQEASDGHPDGGDCLGTYLAAISHRIPGECGRLALRDTLSFVLTGSMTPMVFRHCGPLSRLSHNEFVRLDIETPGWHRHGSRVIHRGLPGLEDEHPQLSEVLTPIVKIRKTVPAKDSLADPIPSAGQSAAKAGSESGRVLAIVIASRCG